jgi:tryptophan-rich sensory protein
MRLWQKILLCIVVAEILGSLGALATASSIPGWFATLTQPPGNPPNWVFGPVWSVLYAMMGASFALVWHGAEPGVVRQRVFRLFFIQLALNLCWSPVFFGAHQIALALAVIVLMALTIFLTILAFRPINRTASLLLVPYLLWVCYATYLNAGYLYLNR